MSHHDLVKKARKWLKDVQKCSVVLAEKGSSTAHEIPDAIGWKSARHSILVECKTSRADFRADSKKWFRQDGLGMGQIRYYLAPKGIIPVEEIPPGWGLLEISGDKIKEVVKCNLMVFDEMRCWAEMPLLIAVVRKLQYQNYNLKKEIRRRRR
jgi:hypothetical protein